MQLSVGYHLDPMTVVWVKGPGYNYKTFRANIDVPNPIFGKDIKRPSDLLFTMSLLVLTLVFALVTLVTDNWVQSNRGRSKSPYQLLKNLFRGSRRPRKSLETETQNEQSESSE